MSKTLSTKSGLDHLTPVVLLLCDACLRGDGGECHTPGCALWMNRAPDVPLHNYEVNKAEAPRG